MKKLLLAFTLISIVSVGPIMAMTGEKLKLREMKDSEKFKQYSRKQQIRSLEVELSTLKVNELQLEQTIKNREAELQEGKLSAQMRESVTNEIRDASEALADLRHRIKYLPGRIKELKEAYHRVQNLYE